MSVSNLHFALFEAMGFEITKLCKLENTCLWEPGSIFISLTSERETSTEILLAFLKCCTGGDDWSLFLYGTIDHFKLYNSPSILCAYNNVIIDGQFHI